MIDHMKLARTRLKRELRRRLAMKLEERLLELLHWRRVFLVMAFLPWGLLLRDWSGTLGVWLGVLVNILGFTGVVLVGRQAWRVHEALERVLPCGCSR